VNANLRCAVCHDAPRGALRRCPCGTFAHRECLRELGRCPTLGCAEPPPRRRRRRTPTQVEGGWPEFLGGLYERSFRLLFVQQSGWGGALVALFLIAAGWLTTPGLRVDHGADTALVKRACRRYQQVFGRLPRSLGDLHCLAQEPRIPHGAGGDAYYRLVRGRQRLFLAWGSEGRFELQELAWLGDEG